MAITVLDSTSTWHSCSFIIIITIISFTSSHRVRNIHHASSRECGDQLRFAPWEWNSGMSAGSASRLVSALLAAANKGPRDRDRGRCGAVSSRLALARDTLAIQLRRGSLKRRAPCEQRSRTRCVGHLIVRYRIPDSWRPSSSQLSGRHVATRHRSSADWQVAHSSSLLVGNYCAHWAETSSSESLTHSAISPHITPLNITALTIGSNITDCRCSGASVFETRIIRMSFCRELWLKSLWKSSGAGLRGSASNKKLWDLVHRRTAGLEGAEGARRDAGDRDAE